MDFLRPLVPFWPFVSERVLRIPLVITARFRARFPIFLRVSLRSCRNASLTLSATRLLQTPAAMDVLAPSVHLCVAQSTAEKLARLATRLSVSPTVVLDQAVEHWAREQCEYNNNNNNNSNSNNSAKRRRTAELRHPPRPRQCSSAALQSPSAPEEGFLLRTLPSSQQQQQQQPSHHQFDYCHYPATAPKSEDEAARRHDVGDFRGGSSSSSAWEVLPDIIASKIFNLVDAPAASTARLVSRSWASAVPHHREDLELSLPVESLRDDALLRFPALSRLRLHVLPGNTTCRGANECSQMPSVAAFLACARPCARVELDLSQTGWCLGPMDLGWLSYGGSAASITRLSLRGCTILQNSTIGSLASFVNLTSLDMSYCPGAGPSTLAALARSVPRLTELNWCGNSWYSSHERESGELGALGGTLTRLNLANCSLSDDALEPLAALSSLESLDLSILPMTGGPAASLNLEFLNGAGLVHLSGLVNLEDLRLQNQIELPCDSLLWLRSLPKLASLDLSGCVSLMDDGDLSPLRHLTPLRTLSLDAINSNLVSPTPLDVLKPLHHLVNLTSLDISGNWERIPLQALYPLAALPRLGSLSLRRGPDGHSLTPAEEPLTCGSDVMTVALRRLLPVISHDSMRQLMLQ